VKITDFGLWFALPDTKWSTTIPETGGFTIYYDGKYLGYHSYDFDLFVNAFNPFTLKFKNKFIYHNDSYLIGRCLTMDDFEIIANPDYKGTV
jgi:hypothetical protein